MCEKSAFERDKKLLRFFLEEIGPTLYIVAKRHVTYNR